MTSDISELPEHQLLWILAFIIFVFTILFLRGLFGLHASKNLDVNDLEHFLITQRLSYDKNCLAYESNRIYPGIIDLNKFEEEKINNCINIRNKQIGIKLILTFDEETKELEINKEITNKIALCKKSNFECSSRKEYVLVKDNAEMKGGYLNIDIIEIV